MVLFKRHGILKLILIFMIFVIMSWKDPGRYIDRPAVNPIPAPTITLGEIDDVCQGSTSVNLPYSETTEGANRYSIDYIGDAEAEGFVDIVDAVLPVSPIILVVPGAAATGVYYGNLSVENSSSGSISGNYIISISIVTTPLTPGLIFGSSTVPESTSGLSYGVMDVDFADSYTWTVPAGWTITSGQGTNSIEVTSGAVGQNGDITVTADNTACSTSSLPRSKAVVAETPQDHSLYGCMACHISHSALGGTLTNTFGNSNLCLSCHTSTGAAAASPFANADKAIPGVSGNSHSWDVASVNATFETVLTSDPDMALRVDEGNITCSTCHNQHNSNPIISDLRVTNAGDAMCKDCHTPRDVGRYADDNVNNRGSHPVGLNYLGTGDYEPVPTGSANLISGKIECSTCHTAHYAPTSDGTLLVQANNDALCTGCHLLGSHQGMGCTDCHQMHNTEKNNIYLVRSNIVTPLSGTKEVLFTQRTGLNSFADGDATYDGICEVCHTTTAYFRNDGSAPDQNHSASGGPMNGMSCTDCHPHNSNFDAFDCEGCHISTAPTYGSAVHVKHKDRYRYQCATCHYQYGFGGTLEGTHPNGEKNVSFDPNGMATRNGQDAITPTFNGDLTCDNTYCHSDGRSAYRGTDGTYTWSATTGSQTAVYSTTPVWGTGTITTCLPCHSGTGNLNDPYTITTPGLSDPLPPASGSHRRGAHTSNNKSLAGNGWTAVNCFWCHNTVNGDDGSPIYQGTYGTQFHVDGQTYFDPRSAVNGGTLVNNPDGSVFTYAFGGSLAHCGSGKACW